MTKDDDDSSGSSTQISKLDFGDPLFLHLSDINSTPLINIKLKGTKNYKSWACAMELALQTKNKMGFINETVKRDEDNVVLGIQWDRCNAVVLSWILGSITDELYNGQIYSKIASEVWKELKETYDKMDGSVIFNLYQKLNSLTQNGNSVSDYYHTLNSLWKQYDTMVQLPSCTTTASKEYKDHTNLIKLMQFLMGLDDIYQPIRSNLLIRDPLPSVNTAFSVISREESHRKSHLSDKKSDSSAFYSNTFKPSLNQPSKELKCTKCGRTNHTIDKCFEVVRYPPRNMTCTKCGMTNHTVDRCFEVIGYPSNLKKKVMKLLSLLDEKGKGKNPASNMADVSDLNLTVGHPNGTKAKVTKIGNLRLSKQIVLQDVLVVPDYCDLTSKKTMMTGNQYGGLYWLTGNEKGIITDNYMINTSCLTKELWHNRLGHPTDQALNHLKESLFYQESDLNTPCDICHQAKQAREPFPLSEHISKELGELIHLDVWGPYKIQSYKGYKYFLTVVDDYTRAVWVYLLKFKSKVFECVENIHNLLINQFNKRIKMIRSDNGTEFVNSNMNKFIHDFGIVHKTSCAYTPQQNGIAERKHRHLLNVATALMFQGGIPLRF
ncbi:uncharacterized protein [Rutidosis leptorrhynchoides]|uniref:uncharacterized protein n=1 Tax=Rutidosis leptorrhynchoides TaxID=125765 RepID=UPI003A98F6BE